jgi:hypothetical protein
MSRLSRGREKLRNAFGVPSAGAAALKVVK